MSVELLPFQTEARRSGVEVAKFIPLKPGLRSDIVWNPVYANQGYNLTAVQMVSPEEGNFNTGLYVVFEGDDLEAPLAETLILDPKNVFYVEIFAIRLRPLSFVDHYPMWVRFQVGTLKEGASYKPFRAPTYDESMGEAFDALEHRLETALSASPALTALDSVSRQAFKHVGAPELTKGASMIGQIVRAISKSVGALNDDTVQRDEITNSLLVIARNLAKLGTDIYFETFEGLVNGDPLLNDLILAQLGQRGLGPLNWAGGKGKLK